MSITSRLLAWSLVLMAIFYLIIIYFFHGIRDLVSTTDGIVNKDFEVVAITEQLVDTTLLFVESRRKYEILGRYEYYQASLDHLNAFERLLSDLPQDADFSLIEKGAGLLGINLLDDSGQQEITLPGEEALSVWIQSVTELRGDYLDRISLRMQSMYNRGVQAQRLGFMGLGLVTFMGLSGSLAIAFFLNRSMREFRKGISGMAFSEDFKPVNVTSHGELGELAMAFNRMGLRLKREEEMRSQFISLLSHEIRTPLTSIRESINLVLEGVAGNKPGEEARFLQIARKETLRLSELLQRLLQTSSLESGKIKLEPTMLNIYALLQQSIDRILPVAEGANVTIDLESTEKERYIKADIAHIQQILFNLLGNAVKFSPPGSRVILSSVFVPGENAMRVRVTDQGPGIPDEEKELVFDRYYRGKSTENLTDGAGLGLNISRHIIRAHGGDLWLEKSSSSGSVFCFTLPVAID